MKRATVLAAAVLLSACNAKKITPAEAQNAVQAAGDLHIAAPVSATGLAKPSLPGGAVTDSVAGTPSRFRADTRGLALVFNGTVAWSLGLVRFVTAFPPTHCGTDTCTWGPWSDALATVEWRLTVTKVDDHRFDYAFAGHLKAHAADPFIDVMTGTAYPAGPLRGHGTFTVDRDAALALGTPATDTGKLAVTWSNESGVTIDATFTGFTYTDNNNHLGNARYAYVESATQGDLQVAFRDRSVSPEATLGLHSRWIIPTGEGRGDAAVDTGTTAYAASECWSGSAAGFLVTWWTSNIPGDLPSGDAALCAFPGVAVPPFAAP
jgi:hypothetical protein